MTTPIGSLIMDLEGKELTPEEREMLVHPVIGGVILFTRNYASRAQLTALCADIRRTTNKPLLILVDQEGGRVQRFIQEFTRLPFMGIFGHLYDEMPEEAIRHATDCGWLLASELLSTGVDLSLAPVLDLNNPESKAIGDRAFHAKPSIVTTLGNAIVKGMREAGMAAVGKHFPGHGTTPIDSHTALPIDDRSLDHVERQDLLPFANLIKAGLPAVMAAHIVFPKIDALPVGYSRFWLQTQLRNRLGFKGSVFSDDLNMEGANISSNYVDRITEARSAGCDFTLLCNNRRGVISALDNLTPKTHQVSSEKWATLKGNTEISFDKLTAHPRFKKTRNFLQRITDK